MSKINKFITKNDNDNDNDNDNNNNNYYYIIIDESENKKIYLNDNNINKNYTNTELYLKIKNEINIIINFINENNKIIPILTYKILDILLSESIYILSTCTNLTNPIIDNLFIDKSYIILKYSSVLRSEIVK